MVNNDKQNNENMDNNKQNNEKWKPYFKRENTFYKKHPFLYWAIIILILLGSLWLINIGSDLIQEKAAYDLGRELVYKSIYNE